MRNHVRGHAKGWLAAFLVIAVAIAVAASSATAHIERAAYWPDPAPDRSVTPAAGGAVPDARSLFTALKKKERGDTRVVCQGRVPSRARYDKLVRQIKRARKARVRGWRRNASLSKRRALHRRVKRLYRKVVRARGSYRAALGRNTSIIELKQAVRKARADGYKLRPSEIPRPFTARDATRLIRFNERLLARCRFDSIQQAVNRSGNNDRVVIMPGLYTEPESRKAPTNDRRCQHLLERNDRGAARTEARALSYPYQFHCPNDQNLIAVMGRMPGPGQDPQPPRWDREGIPNLGRCIRCNLQMEGSGPSPDEVVVEGGDPKAGDGGPSGAGSAKDVGIRADRADGFVLRNMKVRHSHEHTVYVAESDGYRLERLKLLYPGEYGVLTFVPDHGLIQDCEAKGAGDAGIYPGAAPDTGEQTREGRQRYNQEIRYCDMHHNALGYSSTSGNAVHLHGNRFYDNAVGLSTDVFTAAGHPGFPTDSQLIERNYLYSNNFNPFLKGSDVKPTIPAAVGTGMWIAGGNNHTIRGNHFWDNWRRGTMTFSVPDNFVCGPPTSNEQRGCQPGGVSTSHRNKHYGNVMGRTPDGKFDPNGVDFWWDEFADNRNNCWYGNTGKHGTEASITSEPSRLPSDCATSRGTGNAANESELFSCLADIVLGSENCTWYRTPPEPNQ